MSNPIRTIEKSLYEKNRIVLINLKVKSENYEFLLDTGSSDCIIHTKYKDLFITPNEKPVDFDELQTGFGDVKKVDIYELPIFIDNWMFINRFVFSEIDILDYITEATDRKVIGIIGMDFLLKTKAFLDFKQLKIQYNEYNNPSI